MAHPTLIKGQHSLSIRANPKSQSLMTECFVIRMFSGFTSRWMHWKEKKKKRKKAKLEVFKLSFR